MKRTTTSPKLGTKQGKALISAALERVDDSECRYDPNDEKAVRAFWKNAVVVKGGGCKAVRVALAAKRNARPDAPA